MPSVGDGPDFYLNFLPDLEPVRALDGPVFVNTFFNDFGVNFVAKFLP
jgi:hypothetical protein